MSIKRLDPATEPLNIYKLHLGFCYFVQKVCFKRTINKVVDTLNGQMVSSSLSFYSFVFPRNLIFTTSIVSETSQVLLAHPQISTKDRRPSIFNEKSVTLQNINNPVLFYFLFRIRILELYVKQD